MATKSFSLVVTAVDPPGEKVPPPLHVAKDLEAASAEDTKNLVARLASKQAAEPVEQSEKAIRGKSAKKPPKNETETDLPPIDVSKVLASSTTPVDTSKDPLTVVRSFPRGHAWAPIPQVVIVFSKPIVETLKPNYKPGEEAPTGVSLKPAVEGVWAWVSSRTLSFRPTNLAMSTFYTVEVTDKVKALDGTVLAETHTFTFSTATLAIENPIPSRYARVDLQPLIFLPFNQRVDPNALFPKFRLRSGIIFKDYYQIELVPKDSALIDADPVIKAAIEAQKDSGKWILLRPSQPLPGGTYFSLILDPGAPSLEGPLLSLAARKAKFQTRSAFKLRSSNKNHVSDTLCLYFNNNIEPSTFSSSLFTLTPAAKGYSVMLNATLVQVKGKFEFGVKYKLGVSGKLADTFKQSLSRDATVEFSPSKSSQEITIVGAEPSKVYTCNPHDPPVIYISTSNLASVNIIVRKVDPVKDLVQYMITNRWGRYDKKAFGLRDNMGTLVSNTFVDIAMVANERVITKLDLKPFLDQTKGLGHLVVYVAPGKDIKNSEWKYRLPPCVWVQSTKIGLSIFSDAQQFCHWTNSLTNGAALSATVSVYSLVEDCLEKQTEITTNEKGVAKAPLDQPKQQKDSSRKSVTWQQGELLAIAATADDQAVLLQCPEVADALTARLVCHIFDDRHMYKPGETVTVKGYLRRLKPSTDLTSYTLSIPPKSKSMKFTVKDARGAEIVKETETKLPSTGTFHVTFPLPNNANLGTSKVSFTLGDDKFEHSFEIQEFRRPEFKVSVSRVPSEGPYVNTGEATVVAKAEFFGSGPLTNSNANWNVQALHTSYQPPNWKAWKFSNANTSEPAFSFRVVRSFLQNRREKPAPSPLVASQYAYCTSDGNGATAIKIAFNNSSQTGTPLMINATPTYSSPSIPTTAATSPESFVVHPAHRYVAIGSAADDTTAPASFVASTNSKFEFKVGVCGVDGTPVANAEVDLSIARRLRKFDWNTFTYSDTIDKTTKVSLKPLKTGEDGTTKAFIEWPAGGHWELTVSHIYKKLTATSAIAAYVSGPSSVDASVNVVNQPTSISLTADKQRYKHGDTAKVTVTPAVLPCFGIYSVFGHAALVTKTFKVSKKAKTYEIEIPIDEAHSPGLYLTVDTAAEFESGETKRPVRSGEGIRLPIATDGKKLTVTTEPSKKECKPGEVISIKTTVTHPETGKGVDQAQVALFVVDEAILSLSGYTLPSITDAFIRHFANQQDFGTASHLRDTVIIVTPKALGLDTKAKDAELDEEPEEESGNEDSSSDGNADGDMGGRAERERQSLGAASPRGPAGRSQDLEEMDSVSLAPLSKRSKSGGGGFGLMLRAKSNAEPTRSNSTSSASLAVDRGLVNKDSSKQSEGNKKGRKSSMGGFGGDAYGGESNEQTKMQGKEGEDQSEIVIRKVFSALAAFEPTLLTNEEGVVETKVTLPDTLTSYSVWAVATSEASLFGQATGSVNVRLPVELRPHLPRFLSVGDKNVKVGAALVNNTKTSLKALLAVNLLTRNAKLSSGQALEGKRFEVGAGAQSFIAFDLDTTEIGTLRIQFVLSAKIEDEDQAWTDAAEVSIPIWSPVVTEDYALYGELDQALEVSTKFQPVVLPKPEQLDSRIGGLEVSAQATALSSLCDAFYYLERYPYMCTEQISSRVMATIALKSVLSQLPPKGDKPRPPDSEVTAHIVKELTQLAMRQIWSGQFVYWPNSRHTVTIVSLQVLHAFHLAKSAGIDHPSFDKVKNSSTFLRNYRWKLSTIFLDKPSARFLTAYSLYVQSLLDGKCDVADVKKKLGELKKLIGQELDTACLLIMTLGATHTPPEVKKQCVEAISSQLLETADRAAFSASARRWIFACDLRVEALALLAMLTVDPKNEMCYKLVRQIQLRQVNGRWNNTQGNLWAIMSLSEYFKAKESIAPNYTANIWVGQGSDWLQATTKFKERTTEVAKLQVPMAKVVQMAAPAKKKADPSVTVAIEKKGTGALYYRVGVSAAPPMDTQQEAADYGFEVSRAYEAVDPSPNRAVKFHSKSNQWKIAKGTMVKVTVTMTCPRDRYYVALVDRLPAGLEPVNLALKNAPGVEEGQKAASMDATNWIDYQNIRDNQVEAFANEVWPGTYELVYFATAVTEGTFATGPATAEEMYSPEVHGRSGATEVVVLGE